MVLTSNCFIVLSDPVDCRSRSHKIGELGLMKNTSKLNDSSNKDEYVSSKLSGPTLRQSFLNQQRFSHLSLSGREMIVATNHNPGFFELTPGKPHSGVDFEIMRTLSNHLNFTYRVVRPADGQWGNPLPNGTVTGFIGLVARGEADFAICSTTVTSLRETVVDFTFPYLQDPLTLFSPAPKEKNRALAILSPFTSMAWICITVSTSFIGLLLKLESIFATEFMTTKNDWSLQSYSFNMFRNLVTQGNLLRSYRWPQRLIFFSWYIFCLIIATLYSGMLISVLAIPAFENTVDSLADLPRAIAEGFTVGTMKGSSTVMLFKEAKEGTYKQTWELFSLPESLVSHRVVGVQRVLQGRYIYIGSKTTVGIVVSQHGRSNFHIARETFYPQSFAITCPPRAPYKDTFSKLIVRMGAAGLISKWVRDEINKASVGSSKDDSGLRSTAITIVHLQAAFFLIILGSFTATIAFILERIIRMLSNFKKNKRREYFWILDR